MVYKSRVISLDKYFEILQKEYVCTMIRRSFYPSDHDKSHFTRVMKKKGAKIDNIANKEEITSIFNDTGVFIRLYTEIVGDWGFPSFIYNERTQPDEVKKHYKFPYSGTLVFVDDEDDVGLTDYFDFDKKVVYVRMNEHEHSKPFNNEGVHRLTLEQSDKYYYYTTGEFRVQGNDNKFKPSAYNYQTGRIELFDGEILHSTVYGDDVKRILNVTME